MTNIYSPNMLKTYLDCPKKYYYQYIEQLNIPKSTLLFEKGKKIHALANYKLQGIEISRIEGSLTPEEAKIWELLQSNEFYNKDYYKSEFTLSISLNSKGQKYWIGGRIDAIVHDSQKYYILDYKTGQTPLTPEFAPQTMVYLLCADRFIKKYEELYFVYINLKEKNNYVIKFNQELKEMYQTKLLDICLKITSDKTYNKNLQNCKYCEYKQLC